MEGSSSPGASNVTVRSKVGSVAAPITMQALQTGLLETMSRFGFNVSVDPVDVPVSIGVPSQGITCTRKRSMPKDIDEEAVKLSPKKAKRGSLVKKSVRTKKQKKLQRSTLLAKLSKFTPYVHRCSKFPSDGDTEEEEAELEHHESEVDEVDYAPDPVSPTLGNVSSQQGQEAIPLPLSTPVTDATTTSLVKSVSVRLVPVECDPELQQHLVPSLPAAQDADEVVVLSSDDEDATQLSVQQTSNFSKVVPSIDRMAPHSSGPFQLHPSGTQIHLHTNGLHRQRHRFDGKGGPLTVRWHSWQ